MTTPTLKCPLCLAHYVGKHRCDPLIKELVRVAKEKEAMTTPNTKMNKVLADMSQRFFEALP